MKRQNLIWIACAMLCVTTAMATATWRGQPQNDSKTRGQDKRSWPVTDYQVPQLTDPDNRQKRDARGKKYAISGFRVHPEDPSEITIKVDSLDPTLPSFPISRSNTLVVAQVEDAHAYLASDQVGVYSEFSIRLEEVLKNDDLEPLRQGCSIDVEREGGRVRFASGRVHWYGVDKENMPLVGRRYVFFLARENKEQAFHIVTAYELRESKVVPLDELPQFKSQAGKEEREFLNTLRMLLTAS